jgi:hypothetical protein
MRHAHALRLGVVLVVVAVTAVTLAATASGAQLFREPIHEESVEVQSDFCGVPGLTVTFASVEDGFLHAVTRGRDQLVYFGVHINRTEVVTNLANGNSLTAEYVFTDKDLRVTDNGDGTLTILILTTGNAVLYGPDGKAIARNPGQTRIEILVDDAGTPGDPTDDEFLEFLGVVKESTGRTDDFCEAAVPILLG